MTPYPVQLEVSSPARFDRLQLLIRFALAVGLGWLGISAGWLSCLLFLALPLVAAITISARGPDKYVTDIGPTLWRALTWLLAFGAYMLLVIDRVPIDRLPIDSQSGVSVELQQTARPTIGSALVRLVTSIPSAFVLSILGIVSGILLVIAFFYVLFARIVPASILSFQTGYLRWAARLLAYHASFVDEYPPFSFGERSATPAQSAVG